ncbi:DUF58 domain-containing protein [Natronogracilivirga saccharolytica]|uniref:DUF58 domain-containing protein n=1 Tax=Natronogracilivirga saccharolytica TaxID=2812953 RepID=A0A8J7RSF2_9BACT|nr:DUF58 domain-containing protein [Natronogracilivirga saccharolytica]MBP3192914.1 DUF58 domain-containing protein [Natronogracilivirga saccharolytica]
MISKELFKKIRRIEIHTKGLVNEIFGGEYQSAFKGRGMTFSEVRPYQFGDDVRQIDWNVTARSQEPYIKIFEEEREQTLMLCVDISPSGQFGSGDRRKLDLVTELSAVLAFSAIKNNDKVGLLLFTDRIEKVVMPRKGRGHVLRLIRELLTTNPAGTGTDIAGAAGYLTKILKRRSIFILISDFQASGFEKQLRIANRKHDFAAIVIDDPLERELPELGLLPLHDAETGRIRIVDTSSEQVRIHYRKRRKNRLDRLRKLFIRYQIDSITLQTNESYIDPLISFFKLRLRRR